MSISLKAARINKGLKQKNAADALGISVDVLYNYERGKTVPNIILARKMAELYNIPLEEIIFLPIDTV